MGNEESLYYKKDIVVPKNFVRSLDHNNAISSPYIYGYIKKCVHLSAKTLMSLFCAESSNSESFDPMQTSLLYVDKGQKKYSNRVGHEEIISL